MDAIESLSHVGPTVWLVGEVEHADFAEGIALVRATADVIEPAEGSSPELILLAQCRPSMVTARQVDRLRRSAPLAGVVALLGSWCEGETRTGRPVPGVPRFFWYDFPVWWRRQVALHAAGLCPDWARPDDFGLRHPMGIRNCGLGRSAMRDMIALETNCWETGQALSDVLRANGFDANWSRPGCDVPLTHTAMGGIWEGGQLDEAEAVRLAAFCAQLACHKAPVIALLDFPRRDRCERARHAGAAAVLGKPWFNADLADTLNRLIGLGEESRTETTPRAA